MHGAGARGRFVGTSSRALGSNTNIDGTVIVSILYSVGQDLRRRKQHRISPPGEKVHTGFRKLTDSTINLRS